jgi:hypothetical protein
MPLPNVQVTKAVIQRFARVRARYGAELGNRPLVLPDGEWFPDHFRGDQRSVAKLAARMVEYAGMSDIPVSVAVVGEESASGAHGCGSGGCAAPQATGSPVARLVEQGDGWLLQVPAAELRHPLALTTNLARSLAFVFLVETQREGEHLEPPLDVTADLVAVALGFGTLMLQGSYIYAKSCGGPQVASVTKLSTADLAVATALFAALGEHDLGPALGKLDTTQRAMLGEARALVRGNKKLVAELASSPESLASGDFALSQGRSRVGELLGRLFGSDSEDPIADRPGTPSLDELESLLVTMPRSLAAERARRPRSADHDELKALVSQTLDELRA